MGVPPQRIRLSQTAGLLDEASGEASARNPRVEVILLDEFSTE